MAALEAWRGPRAAPAQGEWQGQRAQVASAETAAKEGSRVPVARPARAGSEASREPSAPGATREAQGRAGMREREERAAGRTPDCPRAESATCLATKTRIATSTTTSCAGSARVRRAFVGPAPRDAPPNAPGCAAVTAGSTATIASRTKPGSTFPKTRAASGTRGPAPTATRTRIAELVSFAALSVDLATTGPARYRRRRATVPSAAPDDSTHPVGPIYRTSPTSARNVVPVPERSYGPSLAGTKRAPPCTTSCA